MATVSQEELDTIMEKLLQMEQPKRERYTRKEAIKESGKMLSTLQNLLRKGWSYEDISKAIKEASEGKLSYYPKELQKLYEEAQTQLKNVKKKQGATPKKEGATDETLLDDNVDWKATPKKEGATDETY